LPSKRKNKTIFSHPSGHNGSIRFAYLYVVQELYESFVNKHRIPRPRESFCIHGIPIRSGTDYVQEAFERYDSPIIVEAPVISAANVLAADEEMFRFIGVTYLISQRSHKCGLYYNVRRPEQASPVSGGGIQILLHTGEESIATVMAETYAVEEWGVNFAEAARKIDVGDYRVIYKYVEDLLSAGQPPVLIAFLLSGKLHHKFRNRYQDRVGSVENLTNHFFDIVLESSDYYQPIISGIPGTVLLTRASDLVQHRPIIQRFIDSWYEHIQNLSESELARYYNEWRFSPVPWTEPFHIQNAILYTDFVLSKFGDKKLHKMRQLPIACYEPLFPIQLKDDDKTKARGALAKLNQECAKRSLERFDPTPVIGGKRIQTVKTRAAQIVNTIDNMIKGKKDDELGQNLQKIAECHRQLNRLIDDYLEGKRRQNGDCKPCDDKDKCFSAVFPSNQKIVLQILVWQARFAKYLNDIEESYITQEKLLTGEFADRYRELLEKLVLGDKDWLKKTISGIRKVFNDDASEPKWVGTEDAKGLIPTRYFLTLATDERAWSWFSCRIVDTFNDLVKAKKNCDEGFIEEAKSFIQQAKQYGVFIPTGVFIRLGLGQFISDKMQ
jgi:ribosomal protein L17